MVIKSYFSFLIFHFLLGESVVDSNFEVQLSATQACDLFSFTLRLRRSVADRGNVLTSARTRDPPVIKIIIRTFKTKSLILNPRLAQF